jgi:lipopolysaccharide transport system permease protein
MISVSLLSGLWRYRGFVSGSVKREFQAKYRNSLLGAAWTVLNPLAMIIVYTVIFSEVMGNRLKGTDIPFAYSIYLCSGILTWGLFAEITARSQSMFLDNANLIKKLQFPRICLPVIVILNALVNFGLIFGLFTGFLVLAGLFPGWVFFALFPVLVLQIMLAIGIGMIIGVLNVFFRDVGQFFTILLQFWFWFTPIVYPLNTLPLAARNWISWNPMAPIVTAYQSIILHATAPDWLSLLQPAVLAAACCILGMKLFQKRSGEMVDEL